MASRKANQDEPDDEDDQQETQELLELASMVATIDRVVVSLKRLNQAVSAGGDLHTAQMQLQDALAGRYKQEEKDAKRMKKTSDGDNDEVSESEDDFDNDDDEDA